MTSKWAVNLFLTPPTRASHTPSPPAPLPAPYLDVGFTADAVHVLDAVGRVWVEGVRLPARQAVAHTAPQFLQRRSWKKTFAQGFYYFFTKAKDWKLWDKAHRPSLLTWLKNTKSRAAKIRIRPIYHVCVRITRTLTCRWPGAASL